MAYYEGPAVVLGGASVEVQVALESKRRGKWGGRLTAPVAVLERIYDAGSSGLLQIGDQVGAFTMGHWMHSGSPVQSVQISGSDATPPFE